MPLPQPPPRPGKLSGWEGGGRGGHQVHQGGHQVHQHPSVHSQTHLAGQQWDQGVDESDRGTVRRKTKRRVGGDDARRVHPVHGNQCNNVGRRSKSRSKSRSPGREIERAIVIVHHTTCAHSRTASPDNLSESSISFHENEVAFDLSPGSTNHNHGTCSSMYHGAMEPCVSVAREPGPVASTESAPSCRTLAATALQFSNWESCRESWFSSGSEPRPSSGSDCPPRPPSFAEVFNHFLFSGIVKIKMVKSGGGPEQVPWQRGCEQWGREKRSWNSSAPAGTSGGESGSKVAITSIINKDKKQHTGSIVNILQVRISSFGHPAPICGSPEQQRKQRELL